MERMSVIHFNTEKPDFTGPVWSNTKYIPTFLGQGLKQQEKELLRYKTQTQFIFCKIPTNSQGNVIRTTHLQIRNRAQNLEVYFSTFFNLNHWIVSCRLFNYSRLTDVQKCRRTAKTSETSMYDTEQTRTFVNSILIADASCKSSHETQSVSVSLAINST